MNSKNNPWTTLKSTLKYDNPWIEVVEHDVINPGGGKGIYGKVHFKNQAIGVIPIDDEGNTWLVGQYRYTLDQFSWEMPEGGAPYGEDALETAKRELKEETGLTATSFEPILTMHNSNSVTDEIAHIFLATGLTQGEAELEESESDMVIKKLPFSQALDMVMKGEITDSMTVAGFLKASIIMKIK
ncbi:MAG: NUDIX hydrolase [Fulvivirga sp.]